MAVVPITSTTDAEPVLAQHRFEESALEDYLVAVIDGFARPLGVSQFVGGMSNPTFLLTDGNARQYVMRKKPPGKLLPSAHAVDREFKVIAALAQTNVPVAKSYALCEDESVIGQIFYVMDHVRGRVVRNYELPNASKLERFGYYDAMNDVLARLHNVDFREVGLESYGRVGGYCARQVKRWSAQYQSSKTEEIPEMDKLMAWVNANMPDTETTTIVHGDFRMENLIYHNTSTEVLAIIDWELGTLGDPFSDLAYNCLMYEVNDPARADLTKLDLSALGIPSQAEYVAAYCKRRGLDAIPNWTFYLALSLFRFAAIVQGVYKRGLDGNAASPEALERGRQAKALAKAGWRVVQEGR